MGRPDALSRQSDHDTGKEDNTDVVLLEPRLFINALRRQGHAEVGTGMEVVLAEMRRTELDEEGNKILQNGGDVRINQGLLFSKGKIYIPRDFRHRVIEGHHAATDAGHPGQSKTIELITQNYWWPSLAFDMKQFIRQCLRCQQTKIFLTRPLGLLVPNSISSGPWQEISINLIVGLPDSQGYDSILVIVD